MWAETDLQRTCEHCGVYQKCSAYAPKQLQAFGCPDNQLQVLFVQPKLTDEDVAQKRVMSSASRYNVIDEAMKAAGYGDTWVSEMAQFTVPVRCGYSTDKKQQARCRDLLWMADIIQKRPKLIVCLGSVSENRKGKAKKKISAFQELFGVSKSLGRGRVQSLREVIGDTFKLQAKRASVIEGECDADGTPIAGGDVYIEVPDDIFVMNVTAPEQCLLDPGTRDFLYHDFKKIPKILNGTYLRRTSFEGRQYRNVETFEEATQILDYFAKLDTFAYDIETGPTPYSLDPYSKNSKILCIAFADAWRRTWCIPWDHKDSPLKDRINELVPHLKRTMEHDRVRTWNGKFDNRWLLVKHGIHVKSFRDGMLDRGLLDENKLKKLKLWAEIDTDLGYYDEELQDYFVDEKGKKVPDTKKCYEHHVPLDVLMRYNCADADATMVLTLKYEQDLYAQDLLGYSQIFTMEDVESTALTEHEGVAIDWDHRAIVEKDVTEKIIKVEAAIAADPHYLYWARFKAAEFMKSGKLFWNDGYSWADYEAHLRNDTPLYSEQHQAGYVPEQVEALKQKKLLRTVKNVTAVPKSKRYTLADIRLNLSSNKQLQEFIYGKNFLNLRATKFTESGAPSTDEGVLQNNSAQFPILGHLYEYRKLLKWRSTYLDPVCNGEYESVDAGGKIKVKRGWVRDDNLVHAEFLLTGNDKGQEDKKTKAAGTVTGRKSCTTPNLQNQKSRGEGAKAIKKYFISKHSGVDPHDTGHPRVDTLTRFDKKSNDWKVVNLDPRKGRILQADYSQLELRVFAVDAGISWMIGRYQEDADLHAELACELFNKTMDEVYADGGYWRACAKEFWFGPIYGEGAQGIIDQLKKRHKLVWTKDQGEETLQRMYARMPEFDLYKANVIADLQSSASVRTVFGRRRYLPTFFSVENWLRARAIRQAVNFKVQSAGSDMTTYSWIILNWWARLMGLKSRIVISVHDSLVWDLWPGEEYLVCAATKLAMENLPFSWVKNSPLLYKTEMELGPSWGEIIGTDKLEEFKSIDLDHFMDARLDPLRERCANILF